MRYFRRHADALAQRGIRVNRLANVDNIAPSRSPARPRQSCCRRGADHAAAQNSAVAMRFGQFNACRGERKCSGSLCNWQGAQPGDDRVQVGPL